MDESFTESPLADMYPAWTEHDSSRFGFGLDRFVTNDEDGDQFQRYVPLFLMQTPC